MSDVRTFDTPHGPGRLHVAVARRPRATLLVSHGACGGVDAPEGSTAADQGSDSNAGVPSRAGPWAALAALGTAWVGATLIAM